MRPMKTPWMVLWLCLAAMIAGCGGGSAADESPPEAAGFPEPHIEVAERPEPKIELPGGPPPKQLIVKDLIEGHQPAAKIGDELTVAYRGVYYVNGKPWSSSWEKVSPLRYELGSGEQSEGWERGLRGMKLGGRRELIIPPGLIYKNPRGTGPEDTLLYVVDLLAVD